MQQCGLVLAAEKEQIERSQPIIFLITPSRRSAFVIEDDDKELDERGHQRLRYFEGEHILIGGLHVVGEES